MQLSKYINNSNMTDFSQIYLCVLQKEFKKRILGREIYSYNNIAFSEDW